MAAYYSVLIISYRTAAIKAAAERGEMYPTKVEQYRYEWCQQMPNLWNKPGHKSCSPPWISPACQRSFCIPAGYSPGHVCESTQAGTCPRWTSDSPTTLRAGSSACGPGLSVFAGASL